MPPNLRPRKRSICDEPLPDDAKRPRNMPGSNNLGSSGDKNPTSSDQHNGPPSQLLVWATNRQSLCDALPHFKSHHGGIYTKDKQPLGVLFGRNVEIGDAMMGDKGIYNIGGGRMLTDNGNWARNENYEPKDFTAWETAKEKQLPILVIMDHRHPNFHNINTTSIPSQSDIEPAYVVLGAFFVTEVWQEMSQGQDKDVQYPVVKLMLQRVDTNVKPTYWKGEYNTPQAHDIQESYAQYTCGDCGKNSPIAFDGPPCICLNHKCKSFFSVDGVQLQRDLLEYRPGFLHWIKPFSGDESKVPAGIPDVPTMGDGEYGTELRFRTGMVCPKCQHCDSRVWFYKWKCSCCGFAQMAEPEPCPITEIEHETQQHTEKLMKNSKFFKLDQTTISMETRLVTKFRLETQNSVRTTYLITEVDGTFGGTIVHERPHAAVLQGSCGANELWNEIQEPGVAQNFKRHPAVCPGSIVQKLTRNFTQNFGFHYDFGVKVGDTSFDRAPDVVLKSLVQLSHMGKLAVEGSQELSKGHDYSMPENSTLFDAWQQPNEVLVLAYMEKDMINYHDDGEAQLNGIISTLSLGSPATMKLRIKGKKANKNAGTEKVEAVPVLEVQLQHGDVITMCDTRLQTFTEHAIEPVGIRRFAMTSRVIKPEYYLEKKPAMKLVAQNLSLDGMKESARIPARAARFVFEGTRLEVDNGSTPN
ncbi:unnamed protein product [Discula destructiva]